VKRKEMSELDFKIEISSELFAREIFETMKDESFKDETLERILNSIDITWNIENYRNDIYKLTEKILKDEYDLDLNYLSELLSKNI